jgi:hypothetical protein
MLILIALLELEYHANCMTLNEAALHSELWTSHSSGENSGANMFPVARTNMLTRSLNSCKHFIHTFLSYGREELFFVTAFIHPRLYYAFITLAKIVFLEYETSGTHMSNTLASPKLWNTMDIAKEADFQNLAKQVLDKFLAISTDFVSTDGRRDAMCNLAASMKVFIAGYDQQMKEFQEIVQNSETSALPVEPHLEQNSTNVSTAQLPIQDIGRIDGDFDMIWESVANSTWDWDDIMENFSVAPLYQQ